MSLEAYVDLLLDYNRKVNLVSRRSSRESLAPLVAETLLLKDMVSSPQLIDAGSGGGLLGIPLAISLPRKHFILIESIGKKAEFLRTALRQLSLENASVWEGDVQGFLRDRGRFDSTLAARGFPRIEALIEFVLRGRVRELLLITSREKSNKIRDGVAKIRQTRYNIPSRDNLVIFKMENVSRETR